MKEDPEGSTWEGFGETLRGGDIVEPEPALDAQPVFIGRSIGAIDRDDFVAANIVHNLTANSAIRAHRAHLAGAAAIPCCIE